ncbi:MAG: hypothetical protein ABI580_02645 [Burkholderiaceae bacterium]
MAGVSVAISVLTSFARTVSSNACSEGSSSAGDELPSQFLIAASGPDAARAAVNCGAVPGDDVSLAGCAIVDATTSKPTRLHRTQTRTNMCLRLDQIVAHQAGVLVFQHVATEEEQPRADGDSVASRVIRSTAA